MRAKICGIKDLFTAKIAEEAGADFIGFVFYKKSHRYIPPEKAAVQMPGCGFPALCITACKSDSFFIIPAVLLRDPVTKTA